MNKEEKRIVEAAFALKEHLFKEKNYTEGFVGVDKSKLKVFINQSSLNYKGKYLLSWDGYQVEWFFDQ